MKKSYVILTVCAASLLTTSWSHCQANEAARPEVADWMDAALSGRQLPLPPERKALTLDEVQAESALLWKEYKEAARRAGWHKELLEVPKTVEQMLNNGKLEFRASHFKSADKIMPYVLLAKGEKPPNGWPLFISMHGGGRHHGREKITAHGWDVNSREWQTQMQLTVGVYRPAGLYFLPRMADDRMGRWWHKHNIDIFSRMIRRAILFNEVDPNRIYIMGISQGGYGSCHLAPFMADHFAAAGPMAGGMMTVTENLRNLPFRSDIGEFDRAYNRITLARKLHAQIDSHKSDDPDGYKNLLAIQKGKGHAIDYSRSPDWLAQQTRDSYPEKIVWRCHAKDGVYRKSFYWISLTNTPEKGEFKIVASLDKAENAVQIQAEEQDLTAKGDAQWQALTASTVVLHLNDDMLDLDRQITVQLNGKVTFRGPVNRRRGTMMRNLIERGDLNYAFPVDLILAQE